MKVKCKLKELMDAQQMSQLQLAEQTGLTPSTIGKLYRNQFSRIDVETVKILCKHFRFKSLCDLFDVEWESDD